MCFSRPAECFGPWSLWLDGWDVACQHPLSCRVGKEVGFLGLLGW